ncbi:10 kDa chaperonin [Coraliomargarita sp. CAG:312]|jgi:chaperonin 10 Kd subunit|nr:10 kDa chaperonin [Coraliomargarita sp. CAG:312]
MAKVKIQPLGDRVLVKQVEEKEQVKGGIIIPDSAKEKSQEAQVVAIGSGRLDSNGKRLPFEVKVGDNVLISKYGGTEITFGDEKYTLLREDDIVAILNK